MKILIVNDNPYSEKTTPYIRAIIDNVKACDSTVEFGWGYENFWNNNVFEYDIVHFMFPHLVYINGMNYKDLDKRLEELKSKGIKLAATCHNLEPHYSDSEDKTKSYSIIYSKCHQIYHLGNFSLNYCMEKYPQAQNLLLEHPVYENEFKFFPSKEESLKFLGLKKDYKYVLCMGAFRSKEERNFVIETASKFKNDKVIFLCPSFYHWQKRRNLVKMFIKIAKYICFAIKGRILFPNIFFTGKNTGNFISNTTMAYYYGACDVAFIQRLKILNSGNLPMAFFFAKTVCGPDTGNVGDILKEHRNVWFDPEKPETAAESLRKAIELSEGETGKNNRNFVMNSWTTEKIGKIQYDYYYRLFK